LNKFILGINEINIAVEKLKDYIYKLQNNCIVILRGDLASGKTTFVKSYVKSLNLDVLVTSPTFSIQSIYSNKVYHYDIYNKTIDEFIYLGLLEEFDKKGIHFVEWGDKEFEELLKSYGYNPILLQIEKYDNNKRQYILNG